MNIVLVVNTIRLSENENVKARLRSSNLRVSCSLVFNCKTRLTFCVGLTLKPKHRFLWKISPGSLEFRVFLIFHAVVLELFAGTRYFLRLLRNIQWITEFPLTRSFVSVRLLSL